MTLANLAIPAALVVDGGGGPMTAYVDEIRQFIDCGILAIAFLRPTAGQLEEVRRRYRGGE